MNVRASTVLGVWMVVLMGLGGWSLPPAVLAQQAAPNPHKATEQTETRMGSIEGRILGAALDQDLSDTKVVLVEFKIDEKGKPQGRPVLERKTDAEGRYRFDPITIIPNVVYQLGANVAGKMVGSQPFTFPGDQTVLSLDLRIPKIIEDTTGLKIREAVIVLEPRRGVVWITEVLHLDNGTGQTIEGERRPLTLTIPEDAQDLEWIRQTHAKDRHERLGGKLLVYGNIPPGRTTVAYRYRLGAPLGEVTLTKRYPHPMDLLSVLSPEGVIQIEAEGFSRRPTQEIEGVQYDAWTREEVPPDLTVTLNVSGIPIQQEWLLFSLLIFFLPVTGVAIWFLWVRLK